MDDTVLLDGPLAEYLSSLNSSQQNNDEQIAIPAQFIQEADPIIPSEASSLIIHPKLEPEPNQSHHALCHIQAQISNSIQIIHASYNDDNDNIPAPNCQERPSTIDSICSNCNELLLSLTQPETHMRQSFPFSRTNLVKYTATLSATLSFIPFCKPIYTSPLSKSGLVSAICCAAAASINAYFVWKNVSVSADPSLPLSVAPTSSDHITLLCKSHSELELHTTSFIQSSLRFQNAAFNSLITIREIHLVSLGFHSHSKHQQGHQNNHVFAKKLRRSLEHSLSDSARALIRACANFDVQNSDRQREALAETLAQLPRSQGLLTLPSLRTLIEVWESIRLSICSTVITTLEACHSNCVTEDLTDSIAYLARTLASLCQSLQEMVTTLEKHSKLLNDAIRETKLLLSQKEDQKDEKQKNKNLKPLPSALVMQARAISDLQARMSLLAEIGHSNSENEIQREYVDCLLNASKAEVESMHQMWPRVEKSVRDFLFGSDECGEKEADERRRGGDEASSPVQNDKKEEINGTGVDLLAVLEENKQQQQSEGLDPQSRLIEFVFDDGEQEEEEEAPGPSSSLPVDEEMEEKRQAMAPIASEMMAAVFARKRNQILSVEDEQEDKEAKDGLVGGGMADDEDDDSYGGRQETDLVRELRGVLTIRKTLRSSS